MALILASLALALIWVIHIDIAVDTSIDSDIDIQIHSIEINTNIGIDIFSKVALICALTSGLTLTWIFAKGANIDQSLIVLLIAFDICVNE